MINLRGQLLFTEGKNAVNKFIKTILKENNYCKQMIKKHFNKNLVITVEDEEDFNQVINAGYVINCWLQGKIK